MNEMQKINMEKAIYDYTHCSRIKTCQECECAKTGIFTSSKIGEFTTTGTLCMFLREYTEHIRTKFVDVINEIL